MNGTAQNTGLFQEPVFHEYRDAQRLAETLARHIADRLAEEVEKDGLASLVVSGGSTPRPLFACLRDLPLPWSRITLTLADERWVSADAPESNERMVRMELLRNRAAAAGFVGLKTAHQTPEEGAEEAGARLRAIPRPFSAVVLGMGTDGHTASLFPGTEGLREALDPAGSRLVMAMRPKGGSGAAALPRMTMTLRALAHARFAVLHITGAEKRAVYEQALEGNDVFSMPVRAVLRGFRTPVEVWWAP
ncbi:MAG: 6-phosphogluconolactonase [bacterium]